MVMIRATEDGVEVAWVCPTGHEQLDLYDQTVRPYCEECLSDWDWAEVLTDEEMSAATDVWLRMDGHLIVC